MRLSSKAVLLALHYGALGLVPLAITPVLLRILGSEAFADIAVAATLASYGSALAQFGFYVKGPAALAACADGSERHDYLCFTIRVRLILFILAALVLGGIYLLSGRGALGWHVLLFLLLPMAFAVNSTWFLAFRESFGTIAVLALAGVAVAAGCTALAWVTEGQTRILGAILALIAPHLVVGWGSYLCAGSCRIRTAWNWPRVAAVFRDGLPVFLSQLAILGYMSSGTVVVNWLHPPEYGAAYALLEKVYNAAGVFLMLGYSAAYPKLAELYANGGAGYGKLVRHILAVYVACSVVVVLGGELLAPWVLPPVYGEQTAGILREGMLFFGPWLICSCALPMVTGHFVITRRDRVALVISVGAFAVTLLVGGVASVWGAFYWVAGMIAAQVVPLVGIWAAKR